jgi:PGF-pre-PGF domain-containing protein/PGF-CTERM protein
VGGGNGYQPLATQVQSVTESRVRLSFETPGFSVFVIGDPVTDSGGENGGDGGGSGVGSAILAGEESVTQTLYDGTARRVTVAFDRATSGTVSLEAVGGLPATAPEPNGRTVAAVDVSVPDEAADRPATVEVAVPRIAVEDAGVEPSALRVVRFDGGNDLHRLDTEVVATDDETVVVAAETPGFSTFAVIAPADRATRPTAGTETTPTPTRTPDGSPTATTGAITPTATGEPADGAAASPDPTEGSGNGFGALAALVALLAGGVAMRRR